MTLPVVSSISSIAVSSGARSVVTRQHRVLPGTHKAVLVLAGSNRDILSATFGGVAMTPTGPQVGLRRSFILDDPPAGLSDAVVTFSANGAQSVAVLSIGQARVADVGVED